MHDNPQSAIDVLLRQSRELEPGSTQIALLEEAVRLSDLSGDLDLSYNVRQLLIDASTMGGRPDLSLVTFTWCLSQFDQHQENYNARDVIWKYKWILSSLTEFPQMTRQQIDAATLDMERRALKQGYTRYAVESTRWKMVIDVGDRDEMCRVFESMRNSRRDDLADCEACIQHRTVEHYRVLGEPLQAIKVAEPILQGELACHEIPHLTYGSVLRPLFELDRFDEAMKTHVKGYPLVSRNPEYIDTVAQHLEFLVLTGNHAKALPLISRHLPVSLTNPSLLKRMKFFLATLLAFLALKSEGRKIVRLRLPPKTRFARADGVYPVSELCREFEDAAHELAVQFDDRNDNSFYRDTMEGIPHLLRQIKPYPVPVRSRPSAGGDEV